MPAPGLSSPRLGRLARRENLPATGDGARGVQERCELCRATVAPEHRHVIDVRSRRLMCVCRPCALLFERPGAGAGHLRLVGDRRLRLDGLVIADELWARLDIPVDIAFFVADSTAGRIRAYYPSPLGPTESALELSAWSELEAANSVLASLREDVEALLVNRTEHCPGHWIVPLEDCYRLVAVIRTRWRGFSGGGEVWSELERCLEDLDRGARPASAARRAP